MVGMDACHLVLTYLRMPVVVDFTGGNQVNKQNATYTTDSQFVQDAIENDKRFKIGKIRLISENKIEDEPKAAAPVAADAPRRIQRPKSMIIPKTAEKPEASEAKDVPGSAAVESVKNVNDAIAYFQEKGEVVSSDEDLQALMGKYKVTFPNLK